jgi:hypothetical protein
LALILSFRLTFFLPSLSLLEFELVDFRGVVSFAAGVLELPVVVMLEVPVAVGLLVAVVESTVFSLVSLTPSCG